MKSLELVQWQVAGRLYLALLLFLLTTTSANGQPVDDDALSANNTDAEVIYDQRQNGKYNIRINIKDVAIIEMDGNGFGDENFSDDDYYYDDDNLTVKPLKLTTPSKGTTTNVETSTTSNSPATASTTTQAIFTPATIEEHIYRSSSLATITTHQPNSNQLSDIGSRQTVASETTVESTAATVTSAQTSLEPHTRYSPTSRLIPAFELKLGPNLPLRSTKSALISTPFSSMPSSDLSRISTSSETINTEPLLTRSPHYNGYKVRQRDFVRGRVYHCRTNQFRDINGNCRNKRSASLLKKLFNIIATLPFTFVKESTNE